MTAAMKFGPTPGVKPIASETLLADYAQMLPCNFMAPRNPPTTLLPETGHQ